METSEDAKDKIKEEKEKTSKKEGPIAEKGKVGEVELEDLPVDVQKGYENYVKGGWTSKGVTTPDTVEDEPYENRNKLLPEEDDNGNEITYREHDVNNKVPGRGRNSKRFVTGSDGSVYYTDTHYEGFLRIK